MSSQAAYITSDVGVSKGHIRIGYTIKNPVGESIVRVGQAAGLGTVNVGEYLALITALRHALRLGFRRARCLTDSELLARQLSGRYKVRDERIARFYREILLLLKCFDEVTVSHVRRDKNAEADELAHQTVYEEPVLPAPLRGGGARPRVLLDWQAAIIRSSVAKQVPPGVLARAFNVNTRLAAQVAEGLTYATATLDELPDWSGVSNVVFKSGVAPAVPEQEDAQ